MIRMALFDGINRWWKAEDDRQAAILARFDAERAEMAALLARYPQAPIYRQLAFAFGSDPLRAVELQPDHERQA